MPWRNAWEPPGAAPPTLTDTLRVTGRPSTFLLDRRGRIRAKFVGSRFQPDHTTAHVHAAIEKLLMETDP